MSHKLAKLLLEQAETFLERREAVKEAIKLGMPIREVEEYLDWLEMIRCQPQNASESSNMQSSCSRETERQRDGLNARE
jgi:hypothetical protein